MTDRPTAKVLLVDDSPFARRQLRALLERAGYEVCAEAENGLEAIQAYRLHRPDVVFLDLVMPIMDGLTTLKALRQVDPGAWVVMVSSMMDEEHRSAAEAAGARTVLAKPYEDEDVLRCLAAVPPTSS